MRFLTLGFLPASLSSTYPGLPLLPLPFSLEGLSIPDQKPLTGNGMNMVSVLAVLVYALCHLELAELSLPPQLCWEVSSSEGEPLDDEPELLQISGLGQGKRKIAGGLPESKKRRQGKKRAS